MPAIREWPPVMRALIAQALVFLLLLVLAAFLGKRLPFWAWPLLQGVLAAGLGGAWGLARGWACFQFVLPWGVVWQASHPAPDWVYPGLLLGLVLVFGGGLLTRVPLYNSSRGAWQALLALIPEDEPWVVVDLGAGLGGPLAFLAKRRPRASFVGVEASPLVWLAAWLRTLPVRRNCRIRLGSLWSQPLAECQMVYAFLSPIPMPGLWAKATAEMSTGALLVSNTFAVPGVPPEREIPLSGRRDARLWVYRITSVASGE